MTLPSLIFEPHNGFGGVDPDGDPWPFGYISEGPGKPLFELGVIFPPDRAQVDRLATLALQMAAAPDLVDALEQAEEWLSGWASAEPYLSTIRAALAKARPADAPDEGSRQ